jgi:hypothetical protein
MKSEARHGSTRAGLLALSLTYTTKLGVVPIARA